MIVFKRPSAYCHKCKKWVKDIIEEYQGTHREYRTWDGACYELTGTNLDEQAIKIICAKCKSWIRLGD
jgi:hypothetical protein